VYPGKNQIPVLMQSVLPNPAFYHARIVQPETEEDREQME